MPTRLPNIPRSFHLSLLLSPAPTFPTTASLLKTRTAGLRVQFPSGLQNKVVSLWRAPVNYQRSFSGLISRTMGWRDCTGMLPSRLLTWIILLLGKGWEIAKCVLIYQNIRKCGLKRSEMLLIVEKRASGGNACVEGLTKGQPAEVLVWINVPRCRSTACCRSRHYV